MLRWIVVFGCLLLPLSPGASFGSPSASLVQFPLEVDLGPLFARLDAVVPRQAGNWQGWRRHGGIDVKYRAWRGPLRAELRGDLLLLSAHVRYQVRARKLLLGRFGLDTGCGVDEPPRQALIGLAARLRWGAGWELRPAVRMLPTRFLDRCEVTALGFDVTPLVEGAFRKEMGAALARAMTRLAPALGAGRSAVEQAWKGLATPLELAPGARLELRPSALGIMPPVGQGTRLRSVVGLLLQPVLTDSSATPVPPAPLPPLGYLPPESGPWRFDLALDLPNARVAAQLLGAMSSRALEIEGRRAEVAELSLGGQGQEVELRVRLAGEIAGDLRVFARPSFDAASAQVGIEIVDLLFDSQSGDAGLQFSLFYEPVRAALEEAANAAVGEAQHGFAAKVEQFLVARLPDGVQADLTGLRLSKLEWQFLDGQVRISGALSGAVGLGVNERPRRQ